MHEGRAAAREARDRSGPCVKRWPAERSVHEPISNAGVIGPSIVLDIMFTLRILPTLSRPRV